MFPITHIWFSNKVLGYMNNMTVLGAIFPDIVITKCLEHSQTHNVGMGLYRHIKNMRNDCVDFAISMATHTVNPRGLDYYGDECYKTGYKGYCFQKGAEIVDEVIEACNIPYEFGLWKAHNFIEMGIELNIVNSDRKLIDALCTGLCDEETINNLSYLLENYYRIKHCKLENCFKSFANFIVLKEINAYTLAVKYNEQMFSKHCINIDTKRAADIIDRCRYIVLGDFDVFIEECIYNTSNMLERSFL